MCRVFTWWFRPGKSDIAESVVTEFIHLRVSHRPQQSGTVLQLCTLLGQVSPIRLLVMGKSSILSGLLSDRDLAKFSPFSNCFVFCFVFFKCRKRDIARNVAHWSNTVLIHQYLSHRTQQIRILLGPTIGQMEKYYRSQFHTGIHWRFLLCKTFSPCIHLPVSSNTQSSRTNHCHQQIHFGYTTSESCVKGDTTAGIDALYSVAVVIDYFYITYLQAFLGRMFKCFMEEYGM